MLTQNRLVDNFGLPTFVSSAARDRHGLWNSCLVFLMSSRVLASMLCVGAVAFACGPHARKETTSSAAGEPALAQSGTARTQPAPAHARHDATTRPAITGDLYVRAKNSSVRLSLYVNNNTKKSVELTFPSGQTYDFVVLDTVGRELWRWGNGRMFTQALRNTLLSGGESVGYEETWSTAELPPGHYIAKAVLASENYPIVQQVEFTIAPTTVASR